MSASKWRKNILDLRLVDWLAGLYARMPVIFFGQFYLSNWTVKIGNIRYAQAVRPPLLSGSDEYTWISLIIEDDEKFPYGFEVEPDA